MNVLLTSFLLDVFDLLLLLLVALPPLFNIQNGQLLRSHLDLLHLALLLKTLLIIELVPGLT